MSIKNVRVCLWMAAVLLAVVPAAHAQTGGMPATLDEEYARLAEEVPGFGGLYLDTAGTTHVYLQDLSRAPDVQDLGDHVEVQQGDYDFRDLFAWKDELRPQLVQRGAVFLDIDEQRNRIVLGVEPASLAVFTAQLETFLRSTRIPPEAVLVEATDPIVPQALLIDKIRPVPDGVQTQRDKTSVNLCTVGVNATRLGVKGFVTASHCTAKQGVLDKTAFFQPDNLKPTNRVGVETVDPPFFGGGSCPFPKVCRFSDAAFVAYDNPALSAGGQIANPVVCSFAQGSVTISSQKPRLPLTGFLFGTPVAGTIMAKIGRSTGCTFGITQSTCADFSFANTNFIFLCQNKVAGVSADGDSGAAVFLHGADHATLAGILSAGPTGSASFYTYSPWIFVFTEIGGGLMPDAP